MERILFSPLGDSDPVRNCYDGACLHIVRHYQPTQVVLFYTAEMERKERRDHRYTRALKRLAPQCEVREIFSGIENPQQFDAFQEVLPAAVSKLADAYPAAQILLNLSSGTPQMKTVMALLSVDFPNCVGVQVDTPMRGSNRSAFAAQDDEDVEALLENNFDEEPDAVNRCHEPALRVFRYYAERSRILSLAETYEYPAALRLARGCPELPQTARQLLEHAAARSALQAETAKKALSRYDGKELFPVEGAAGELLEYFLLMQMDERCGRLSNMMVRVIPFLYSYLLAYERKNLKSQLRSLCERKKQGYRLTRASLAAADAGFLAYLDQKFWPEYREGDLSFLLLYYHGEYLKGNSTIRDAALHAQVMAEVEQVACARELRNSAAHEMVNVTRASFVEAVGMEPAALLNHFWQMLLLLCGSRIRNLRGIYDDLNRNLARELR